MKAPCSFLALAAILNFAGTAISSGVVVSTFSVDMLGNFQPDVLTSTDIAGVVPAAQWLPAPDHPRALQRFGSCGGLRPACNEATASAMSRVNFPR